MAPIRGRVRLALILKQHYGKQVMKPILELMKGRWSTVVTMVVVLSMLGVAVAMQDKWLPRVRQLLLSDHEKPSPDNHASDSHAGHNHGHAGHDEANSIELSPKAWKNIGLKTGVVKPDTFVRTVTVPAMVVERPGRSQVEVTAPLNGIVTRVYPIQGEKIQPGQRLFTLRLTHEDLVTAQRAFLQSAQELDVVLAEIRRLESVGEGIIAGRRVLEQKYEQQKAEAAIHAQRQGLLLHGLSDQQIDEILKTRRLLQSLTVVAPAFPDDVDHQEVKHVYHVQKINVRRGQHVVVGTQLGMLADHCLLYVEGQAFEDDAQRLTQAAHERWPVEVIRASSGDRERLLVHYVADHVEAQSRSLRFYLTLTNQLVRDEARDEHPFIAWKYRPGQRMQVRVPTAEPWRNQIVLPIDAVVAEGADAFIFQQNGEHFDRLPVHVLHRDKDLVVVENDNTLVGTTIAMSGAYQMQLALKNKANGGVDPHAGHNH